MIPQCKQPSSSKRWWRQDVWTKSRLNGAVMGSQRVVQRSAWSSDPAVDWSHELIPCDCFPSRLHEIPMCQTMIILRAKELPSPITAPVPAAAPPKAWERQCSVCMKLLCYQHNMLGIQTIGSNWMSWECTVNIVDYNYACNILDFCSTFICRIPPLSRLGAIGCSVLMQTIHVFAQKVHGFWKIYSSQMFGMGGRYRKRSVAVQVWEKKGCRTQRFAMSTHLRIGN